MIVEQGARDVMQSPRCDTWPGSIHSVDFSYPIVKQGSCHCPVHSWSIEMHPSKLCIPGPCPEPGHAWEGTNVTLSSKTICLLADKTKRLTDGLPVEHRLTGDLACSMSSRDLPVLPPEMHSHAKISNPTVPWARNAQPSTTILSALSMQTYQGRLEEGYVEGTRVGCTPVGGHLPALWKLPLTPPWSLSDGLSFYH